jgi:hypothetical protein
MALRLPAHIRFVDFVGPNREIMQQYTETGYSCFLAISLILLAARIGSNIQKPKMKVNWSPTLKMTP